MDLRDRVRKVLVGFLDWESSYEQEGWGSADDANRDYDRLTEEILNVIG